MSMRPSGVPTHVSAVCWLSQLITTDMAARLPSIHVKLTRKAMRRPVAGELIVKFLKQSLSLFLSCCLVLATAPAGFADQADQSTSQPPVQAMRQRAKAAGNLNSTSQEKVSQQGQTIVIEPAEPQVVYVPEYDPWLVYGEPIGVWPGWYWYPGLYLTGPGLAFGLGFGIGFFGGFGWGWHHWGSDWNHHGILFDHHGYISHSRVFVNRNNFNRARASGGFHGGGGFRGGRPAGRRGFGGGLVPQVAC